MPIYTPPARPTTPSAGSRGLPTDLVAVMRAEATRLGHRDHEDRFGPLPVLFRVGLPDSPCRPLRLDRQLIDRNSWTRQGVVAVIDSMAALVAAHPGFLPAADLYAYMLADAPVRLPDPPTNPGRWPGRPRWGRALIAVSRHGRQLAGPAIDHGAGDPQAVRAISAALGRLLGVCLAI